MIDFIKISGQMFDFKKTQALVIASPAGAEAISYPDLPWKSSTQTSAGSDCFGTLRQAQGRLAMTFSFLCFCSCANATEIIGGVWLMGDGERFDFGVDIPETLSEITGTCFGKPSRAFDFGKISLLLSLSERKKA